jgi:hypothetical protein
MIGFLKMNDVTILVLIAVMFLFAVIVITELMAFMGHGIQTTKECVGPHSWEYGSDGELMCSSCKRKAKDILK